MLTLLCQVYFQEIKKLHGVEVAELETCII